MADKTTVQITKDNIDELNIKVGTILKDNEGLYWKITDFNNFTAGMRVCDKDGNEIENFVGNAERAIFGGGLSDLLNDGVTTYYIESENPEIETQEEKNIIRVFTVFNSVFSAVDRADFLASLDNYENGKKKEKDTYKIKETLNRENIKPVRFVYEGYGYLGPSIYESFVCKNNDNSGFRYLMVPHNPEYYKGFDKLILSEKTFDDIEECQKSLIDTLVNLKDNHNFKIENEPFHFYNIPEKFKQPLLSYIADNEKEICQKAEEWLVSHPDFNRRENIKDNIALYLIQEDKAVNFNSPEWIKKFEMIELSMDNPLLANAILEKENKENKTMTKEQKCIAKWIDKDGNTINFERFSTNNIKKIENDCIELNADTLIASKDTLSNFDYFKVFETEPDGTNEKLMLTIPAHLYLESVANFYKKKHEHFPYEDEFDAARWKNITEKREERMGITELTPEKYMELYNNSINKKERVFMDLDSAKAVLDSCANEFGLKLKDNNIISINGKYPSMQEIVPSEILRASIIGREQKASINLEPRVSVIWDSLGITGNGKEYIFNIYLEKLNELYRTDSKLEKFGFNTIDSTDKIQQVRDLTTWALEKHPEVFMTRGKEGANKYNASYPDTLIDIFTMGDYLKDKESELNLNKKNVKYSYFVKDTAEFEQFADFEPIPDLNAKEAVGTMFEQIRKGLSAGIGIHIPDDFIFNDPYGEGAIIFSKVNENYSFYMGDNFVKDLKKNDEHARNVINAFKELDEAIRGFHLNQGLYKEPDFLYIKEKELKNNDISPIDFTQELESIQNKIKQMKNELNNPDPNNPDDENYIKETKQYIEKLEHITDDEIRKNIIWKKQNQRVNEDLRFNRYLEIKESKKNNKLPENGNLFSNSEIEPIYEITNKTTNAKCWIKPSGIPEKNVMSFGNLNSIQEARDVIEKIKNSGFKLITSPSDIVIYDDEKFYDFKIKSRNKSDLQESDFIKYITNDFKITRRMKSFEKLELDVENISLLWNYSDTEIEKICQGLWEAEDKILIDEYRKQFPSKNDMPPVYLGSTWVQHVIQAHRDEYKDVDFSVLLEEPNSTKIIKGENNMNTKDTNFKSFEEKIKEVFSSIEIELREPEDKEIFLQQNSFYNDILNVYRNGKLYGKVLEHNRTDKAISFVDNNKVSIYVYGDFVEVHQVDLVKEYLLRNEAKGIFEELIISPEENWQLDKELLSKVKEADKSKRPSSSIWGTAQSCNKIIPGVYTVTTAGHGGLLVHKSVADLVLSDEAKKEGSFYRDFYQFEEDNLINIPLLEMYHKHLCETLPWNVEKKDNLYKNSQRDILRNEPEYAKYFYETYNKHPQQTKNTYIPKPVTLEEILNVMDFKVDISDSEKIKIFDNQRGEYIDNGEDFEGNGNEAYEFTSASEIFERLDTYISDYIINDMVEQLNVIGAEPASSETLEDLCLIFKNELEKGNTELSEGELNLAWGIVNPETVIMPNGFKVEKNIENKSSVNNKLSNNIDWTNYTEDDFNKTKADLQNWKDGNVYASINVGHLSFELVPQNYNDRMGIYTRIYYPDLNATYGEDADGVRYDTADGFDIDSETFIKMSYKEFKDYFENTVLPSSLDESLTEKALQQTEDWNTIWEKLNREVKTNYVLERLAKAGIEVVTDKSEFDKILESQNILQKMATSLSKLNKLSKEEKNLQKDISKEQEISQELSEKEETINNHYFESFVSEIQKYQDIFSKDVFIKICNLDYENLPSKNFELYLGKDWRDEHLVLSLNCETPGHKHDFHSLAFYDITENKELIDEHSFHIGYGDFPYKRIANDCLNVTKKIISDNDYIPQIQNILKEVLESQQIKEKAILEDLIQKNNERKITIENKLTHINLEEKRAAEKTLESWLELADDMEDSLWNKDQLQVKKLFLENGTEERKPIAIITKSCMTLFEGIKDHNLYADKSYVADHYINRYHNARTFLNIQNVLDNYDNIYFDKDQNSIGFAKKYGKMVDCVFVRSENGKIVLFGTTYEQPEYKLENGIKKGRYVIITPVMLQKENMSVEGSTPLSHNSIEDNGKAAVAISDVTDKSNITDSNNKSITFDDGSLFVTQMKTEEIKADIYVKTPNDIVPYLKDFANSEVENFGIVMLDGSNKVKEIRSVSVGTVNRSLVHSREVFKEAIRKNATAVLVFHNHPSENTEPSNEDIQTTKRLMEASNIIGIQVLDHIIVSPDNYFSFVEHDLLVDKTQNMILPDGTTFGFTHNDKIYLNPDIMNSEAAVHEYTHLWDAYIQRTNPELWNKGLEVFKNTSLWNDVINDENYSDIKNNENLVLSECHARLCGKIADEVLQKVLERDGDLKKADMINWDNETWEYIGAEFRAAAIKVLEAETKEFSFDNTKEFLEQFLSTPMKDLFQKELNIKLEKTYEQKYPSYIKNRFVLEQNHPDGWAVGKNMWVVWDNLLNKRGRSGGFFDTEKGIEAGNKELNEIIDSVNKSETEALEKEYEGNGVYTCQLFSDYSGYGSTTTRHDMLFVSAKNNKRGTGIDVAGVRDSDCGTIRSYIKDYAKRNNILSDGLIVSFNPVDKRKEANKLWTDFSMLAKETDTSFVYQDGDKESRYAFAIDYAQKHNLPCFLIDNEISRKVANDVDFVIYCKDYEDIITKVKSLTEKQTISEITNNKTEFNGKPKVLEGVTASELLNGITTEVPSENQNDKKQANSIELTSDDLKNAKALLPKEQYQLVLSYTQGEEAEHFKGIIKEISAKAEKIKGKGEILTEDEKHPLAFKYTLGNSRFYFSEWDGNDELFGYVVLNNDTQNSEWGYTSLEELKNAGERDSNGFPVLPEMTFYGLEETIEKQISIDYPELSEKMGFSHKKNHNEELISEFGKEILETLDNRKLEHSAYNICCAAQFVLRSMDSSERKEVFSIMEKCGCQGKYIKENTEDFLTEVINAESKTASAVYSRNRLYERINKACSTKKIEANKGIQNPESDYDMEI